MKSTIIESWKNTIPLKEMLWRIPVGLIFLFLFGLIAQIPKPTDHGLLLVGHQLLIWLLLFILIQTTFIVLDIIRLKTKK